MLFKKNFLKLIKTLVLVHLMPFDVAAACLSPVLKVKVRKFAAGEKETAAKASAKV